MKFKETYLKITEAIRIIPDEEKAKKIREDMRDDIQYIFEEFSKIFGKDMLTTTYEEKENTKFFNYILMIKMNQLQFKNYFNAIFKILDKIRKIYKDSGGNITQKQIGTNIKIFVMRPIPYKTIIDKNESTPHNLIGKLPKRIFTDVEIKKIIQKYSNIQKSK